MEFYVEGKKGGPLVVCIHALMGGPEDYLAYRKKWGDHCELVLMDMDVEARALGWSNQAAAAMALDYSGKSQEIANHIRQNYPGKKAFFVGISLGGKILYEIAAHHSDIFAGGVVTDTGVGSLADSEFAKDARDGVYTLDLNKPWEELKKDLEKKFPDRKTRILVSTQLHYPDPNGPAQWKPGLGIIYDLIMNSQFENQWPIVEKMNPEAKIIVLRSLERSGIGAKDFKKMKALPVFDIMEVPESNHFFHISSHEYVTKAVLYMAGIGPRPKLGKKKFRIKLPPIWQWVVDTYVAQKQMEKQIIYNLQPERIGSLHPVILPNILRRLEPKMLRKLDAHVLRKLPPEISKSIPQDVMKQIDKILSEHRTKSNLEVYFGIRPAAIATAVIVLICLVTFLMINHAEGNTTGPTAPTTQESQQVFSSDAQMKLDEKGKKVAAEIEKFHLGFKGEESEIEMILVSPDGQETVRKMKGKTLEGKDKKSFKSSLTFSWPPDIKGTKILLWNDPKTDNSQWVYLPSSKRVKRIASRNASASFMGSEFTFEDLGGTGNDKFDYRLIEENGKDDQGKPCWILEIYPRGETSGYKRIKSWILKDVYSPSKIEYFDRKGELLKVSQFRNYKQFSNRWWRVGEIELTNVQSKKKTIMKWVNRELGKSFREDEFSPERMTR